MFCERLEDRDTQPYRRRDNLSLGHRSLVIGVKHEHMFALAPDGTAGAAAGVPPYNPAIARAGASPHSCSSR